MVDPVILIGICCAIVAAICLSLTAVYMMRNTDSGSGGGGGGGGSLPIPRMVKGVSPWNIEWIGQTDHITASSTELTINYTKGKVGGSSGAAFRANPYKSLPSDSATLSYDIYFPPEFDWVKGGKLPGVCIGTSPKECSTGGDWQDDQGSVRLMWKEEGHLIGYTYLAIKGGSSGALKAQGSAYKAAAFATGGSGHSMWKKNDQSPLKLVKGWNTLSVYVKLNTPGSKNGILKITCNGKTKSLTDVVYRESASVKVTSVNFVSFFGGSGSDWASSKDTFTKYRNIKFSAT